MHSMEKKLAEATLQSKPIEPSSSQSTPSPQQDSYPRGRGRGYRGQRSRGRGYFKRGHGRQRGCNQQYDETADNSNQNSIPTPTANSLN